MDAGPVDGIRGSRVRVAATFTLDPLVNPLERELRAGPGPRSTVTFAPNCQVVRELLDPAPAAHLVALVRWEDWFRFRTGGIARADLDAVPEELLRATRDPDRAGRLLIVVCPPSAYAADSTVLAELDERCARSVPGIPGVEIAWARNWVGLGCGDDVRDSFSDRIAHIPYTDEYFEVLAERIASWVGGGALASGPVEIVTACGPSDAVVADSPALVGNSVATLPHGRFFEHLADRAGPLHAGAKLGVLSVDLSPRGHADADLAHGARARDALVTDLLHAVRAYRATCSARLLLVMPEPPVKRTPPGNLAHHAAVSLRVLAESVPGVLVIGADPALLASVVAVVGETDPISDTATRGGVA